MKLAPALAAGNTIVIKPSEHTSASLLELMPLIEQAGFPPGVVNVVTGFGADAGAALVGHEDVAKIAFTGSSQTGARIAAQAGGRLARVTLELGGKSPQLVFDDADPQSAAMGIVAGVFAAAGQTCVAGSRVFLQEGIYDEVLARVLERTQRDQDRRPAERRDRARAAGAQRPAREGAVATSPSGATPTAPRCCTAASQPGIAAETGGWFHEPTIFTDARNDMRVCQEEIFGPVAMMMQFRDEAEARAAGERQRASGSRPASGRATWRGRTGMAAALDAGTVWINTYRAMAPMSPLGGFKQSGMGKENSPEVMREYTRLKSVWVNTSDEPTADPFVLR